MPLPLQYYSLTLLLLIFDNYDSFTFNLCDYFKQLGQELLVIRNDEKTLEEIENIKFSGIVLCPGPGIPETSGILMPLIERWHKKVPFLGICLGHQALGTFFGGHLIKAPYPMHGKVSTIQTAQHIMWNGLPERFDVCRYHSLVNTFTPKNPLLITATSMDDKLIMAIAHQSLPIWGIQFHPEAILTQYGTEILNNWLKAFILQR